MCSLRVLLVLAALSAALPASAADDTPRPRLAIDDVPRGAATTLLESASALEFQIAVRVVGTEPAPDAALEARLSELARRRTPIWLSLPAPDSPDAVERWRPVLKTLLDRHGDALTILEVRIDRQADRVAAFAVQAASTEVGERRAAIRVALGGSAMQDADRRSALVGADLAAYVDLLVVVEADQPAVTQLLAERHMQSPLAIVPAPDAPPLSGTALLEAVVRDLGTEVTTRAVPAAGLTLADFRRLTPLSSLLEHVVTPLDEQAVGLALTAGGRDVRAATRHRVLFDADTFSTFLLYTSAADGAPLSVAINSPMEGTPAVVDLLTGARAPGRDYAREAATGRVSVQVPQTGHLMLVDFNEGAVAITERSGVTAERALSVGEIIARHQQQQRAQDALIEHYVAHVRMEQHFRPTVADPGYDVVTENRYFYEPGDVEWQELSFAVNNSTWGEDRPPFPLLQPEKVLALPLQLKFDEGYRYRLAGTGRVDGVDCYEVRFEPERDDSALYRGAVWIDRRTFARIRVKAVQGGLSAPVVSNEEDLHFSPVTSIGNRPIYLFSSMTARQIMLVAGRNLLVEKMVRFSDFRVNGETFADDRASARESRSIMFRETPNGLRYYVTENGRRVISERPTSGVRALAMGVTLDPSYTFPLPILGLNILDFDFGNKDTQFALLFAGVLAAGNIQRSNLFDHKTLDASLDFFAIAAPSTDREYIAGKVQKPSSLLTWPLSTGLNVGWQATPFMKATFQYQFKFDPFVRDRETEENYVVPSSTITNGVGGAWEFRRGGYSLVLNGAWYTRGAWKTWGDGTDTSSTYAKYTAGLSRDFFLGPFQKIHLNGAWFGGHDLDRFNKYQFGLFDDTRIHGVPSSGVRFAELAMARGTYSFNIFDQYRFDLFLEHAWGRDTPGQGAWERVPGFGTAVNVRAPWNTILRADFGKSILPDRYGNLGSTTLQIMLLKPLR